MNSKLRSALQKLISIILVFVAYWNICAFEKNVADLRPVYPLRDHLLGEGDHA